MTDPANLWLGHESRAATFENPTAARGAGGRAGNGRKGAPNRVIRPGERVVLADVEGPGRVSHIWMTVAQLPNIVGVQPAFYRAQTLEVFYGDLDEPSVSVPAPDFFGVVHGVVAPYASALTAANEGRGWESRVPMPFGDRVRIEYTNASDSPALLYYQVDLLLGDSAADGGRLHATFNRQNPTTLTEDLVIAGGLRGPGRFLGMTGGVRPFDPRWWGEGEVKVFLDGDEEPTICGTGSEDYLGSAWGLGAFTAPETGAPLVVGPHAGSGDEHSLVSFYRWHLSDPIVFNESARVTIQQIGSAIFTDAESGEFEAFRESHDVAGLGWIERLGPGMRAFGLYERSDDWCATGFTYCAEAQPVPRVNVAVATADLTGVPEGHQQIIRT
jgi:hypothetical protein